MNRLLVLIPPRRRVFMAGAPRLLPIIMKLCCRPSRRCGITGASRV